MTETLSDAAAPAPIHQPPRPARPAPPMPHGRPPRPSRPGRAGRPPGRSRPLNERPVFVVALTLVTILFAAWELTGTDDAAAPSAARGAGPAGNEPVAPGRDVAVVPAAGPAVTPTGEFARVPGTGALAGSGRLITYRVEVETGVPVPPSAFAAEVDAALLDPRSWAAVDGVSLQRTDGEDATLTVVLASPSTTDRLCRPLRTMGRYSCFSGDDRAVINADRWLHGAPSYAGDLPGYRTYVVNHEVGHVLGHGHRGCPAPGAPAPVMVQQTKGLSGCARNPWPATG